MQNRVVHVAVAALGLLIALTASLGGLWVLIAVDVLLLIILAMEHYRVGVANQMIPVA